MSDEARGLRKLRVGREQEIVDWVRYPADVARLVIAALVWCAVTGLAVLRPEPTRSVSLDLVRLLDGLPVGVAEVLVGVLQLAALVVPLVALVLARRGRWRELAQALGAALGTIVIGQFTDGWFSESIPSVVLAEGEAPSWVLDSSFPSGTYLAAVAAAVTVVAPSLSRPWRQVVWWTVALVAVARVVAAVATPASLLSPLAVGVFVGSAVMVACKSPLRSPRALAIQVALAQAGVVTSAVVATDDRFSHGPTYRATASDGRSLFVKAVGRDERNAQILSRTVRALRVESPEDRWTGGARETIEHEALMLGLAAKAGAAVPEVEAVGLTDERASLLVMVDVAGQAFTDVDELTDAQVAAAFANLAALHQRRIVHGWASFHHAWLGDDGVVRFLDLRWASPAATDEALAADLAELLCSAAAHVGIGRTVAAARASFADDELGATLAFIQPLAVAPETRKLTKKDKELLGDLRTAVQEAAGVEAYEMAEIERLSIHKVVMFVGTLFLAYFLLTLLSHWSEIWDAMQTMSWAAMPVLFLIGLLGFPAGALSLMGAVMARLKFWHTTEMMFAQSFLNRFTPANAGGMALRTVYLQRNGATLLTAASAVGLTSAASGVMQVVMALAFFTWAGQSDEAGGTFNMPEVKTIVYVVLAIAAVIGIAYATTAGRRLLLSAWKSIRSSLNDFRELARHPSKLFLLFFGAGASKLVNIVALYGTILAFGETANFAAVGAMYITATTVAAAVPTPGGVGPIEAALTAGLTGLGIPAATSAAIAVMFRVFTYWLPTIPSWYALHRMEKAGEV